MNTQTRAQPHTESADRPISPHNSTSILRVLPNHTVTSAVPSIDTSELSFKSSWFADAPLHPPNGYSETQCSKKRDSAVERSNSTARFETYAGASDPSRRPSYATTVSLRKSPSLHRLSNFSAHTKLRKKTVPDEARPVPEDAPPVPPQRVRVASFHGISMDIPKGELEGLTEADGFTFSSRGSVLLGGKLEETLMKQDGNTQGDDLKGHTGHASASPMDVKQAQEERAKEEVLQAEPPQDILSKDPAIKDKQNEEIATQKTPSDTNPEVSAVGVEVTQTPKRPEVRPREPTATSSEGGRVLSAEDVSFSIRLRSMYDHGEEKAADWTTPGIPEGTVRPVTPDGDQASIGPSTPDASTRSLSVRKHRDNAPPRPSMTSSRMHSIPRTSTEVAGGMEDFEDVSASDVDRYGFIVPSAMRTSISSVPRPGVQRVATSLQLAANTPRRKRTLRRGPSFVTRRSSVSGPPSQRTSMDGQLLRAQTSSYSLRRSASRMQPKSRQARLLDQAGDMLTPPAGLESIAEGDGVNGRGSEKLRRREWIRDEKWRRMAQRRRQSGEGSSGGSRGAGGMAFAFDTTDPQLVSRVWKGIPDKWRATAWHAFLSESRRKRNGTTTTTGDAESHDDDDELVRQFHALQDQNCPDDVQIDVDVPRSIGMHVMFRKRYRGGQRLLFRVLRAIALKFPETGYVQGMASVATTLLCYFDEEMAFVMMVRLWELRGLKRLFGHGFGGLMEALGEFEGQWLRGEIKTKLEELGIDGTAYGTRWYLTLFNMSIPFSAQLRVWDVFMLLGDEDEGQRQLEPGREGFDGARMDVLHAVSAALVDATREIVLEADFEIAMKTLTSWIPIKDEDLLMRVAKAEFKAKQKRVNKTG